MNLLRLLIHSSRWTVLLAVLTGGLSGLSSAGLIAVINSALDSDTSSTTILVGSFSALIFVMLMSGVASANLVMQLGQSAVFQLRLRLSRQILSAPLRQLQDLGSPRLLANLTEDIKTITESLATIPAICIDGMMILGCLAYLGWLSRPFLAMVLGLVVVGSLGFRMAQLKAVEAFRSAREHDDAMYTHYRALTEGIKELKLHRPRRDIFLSKVLKPTVSNCRRDFSRGLSIYILANNLGNALFYLAIGAVLFILPQWQDVPAETFRGYTLTILYLMMPLRSLLDSLPILSQARVALDKVERLGDTLLIDESAPLESRLATMSNKMEVRIDLVAVTHRNRCEGDDDNFRLGPLSLTLLPGELVFLAGGNGSGKTTLAMLLLGLYVPESGRILLDGQPVTDANREHYRQHFSAVFSDFFLFDKLLGLPEHGLDEQARVYLDRLKLNHAVQVHDGVFSTLRLSQGQRKRLALLTVYIEDRPVYVFDEWAADQDPVFKKIFYTELLPDLQARGKTVLVITHDDRYFHVADRCVKLDYGQIVHDPQSGLVPESDQSIAMCAETHAPQFVSRSPGAGAG
ncbi:MAG: cyclic peptide export ABC transporter [Methylococcales bacterium]